MGPFQYAVAALGVALAVMYGFLHIARADLRTCNAEFTAFKQTVEANGKRAQAEAKLKETQNAQAISGALTERDAALGRLRDSQKRSASRRVSKAPAAPAGSDQVCIGSAAYNAAFQRFRERLVSNLDGLGALAVEGDEAQLDAQTLIQAWPR